VRRSRFCAEFVRFGGDTRGGWLEWLMGAPRGAVVLPCSDAGLELVARHRGKLARRGLVTIEADDDVLLAMLDKQRTHELAMAAGVPVPLTALVRDREDLAPLLELTSFPCALKPIHSHRFRRHFDLKGLVAHTPEELERHLERTSAFGLEMLLTEMVPGPDRYQSAYAYIDHDGRVLFSFSKQKLRQWPVRYGGGCFHVTDHDPEVIDLALRFLRGAGVRGLANVEFKRDFRDGHLKLIECNHRMTEATGLICAAGMDLPLFLYTRVLGLPEPDMRDYRKGLALWYPFYDFRAARAYRKAGELSFAGWVRSLMRPLRFPLYDPADAGPAASSLRPRLVAAWRRLKRTPRPAAGPAPRPKELRS
jgi:predicted ATP-grasp superfamily ATP-dependent carboligase